MTLAIGGVFRGFIIQARGSPTGEPLGIFVTAGNKTKTLRCMAESVSPPLATPHGVILHHPQDTASHANPDPVQTITVQWSADLLPEDVEEITFQ